MKRVIPLISALIIGNCLTLGEIYGTDTSLRREDISLKNTVCLNGWNVYDFTYNPRAMLISELPEDKCPISYIVSIDDVCFPTLAEFKSLINKISYSNSVEEIIISNCCLGSLRSELAYDIFLGSNLRHLSFSNCRIAQLAANKICSALKTAPRIEKFSMIGCLIEGDGHQYSNTLSSLKVIDLDFRHTYIGNFIDLTEIEKQIRNNLSLRNFNLIGCGIPPENIEKLQKLKDEFHRDELQILFGSAADGLPDKLPKPLKEAVIKDIPNEKLADEIKKLNPDVMYNLTIDNVPISKAEIPVLRQLLQSRSINVLSVISCGLTKDHIIGTFDGIKPNGKYVDLSNNELDKDAYDYLQRNGWLNVCLFGNPCFLNIDEIADKSKLRKLSQQAKDAQPSPQSKKAATTPVNKKEQSNKKEAPQKKQQAQLSQQTKKSAGKPVAQAKAQQSSQSKKAATTPVNKKGQSNKKEASKKKQQAPQKGMATKEQLPAQPKTAATTSMNQKQPSLNDLAKKLNRRGVVEIKKGDVTSDDLSALLNKIYLFDFRKSRGSIHSLTVSGSIHSLTINGIKVTEKCLKDIGKFKKLTNLSLNKCELTSKDVIELTPTLKTVPNIDLSNNEIDLAGKLHLYRTGVLSKVNLTGNPCEKQWINDVDAARLFLNWQIPEVSVSSSQQPIRTSGATIFVSGDSKETSRYLSEHMFADVCLHNVSNVGEIIKLCKRTPGFVIRESIIGANIDWSTLSSVQDISFINCVFEKGDAVNTGAVANISKAFSKRSLKRFAIIGGNVQPKELDNMNIISQVIRIDKLPLTPENAGKLASMASVQLILNECRITNAHLDRMTSALSDKRIEFDLIGNLVSDYVDSLANLINNTKIFKTTLSGCGFDEHKSKELTALLNRSDLFEIDLRQNKLGSSGILAWLTWRDKIGSSTIFVFGEVDEATKVQVLTEYNGGRRPNMDTLDQQWNQLCLNQHKVNPPVAGLNLLSFFKPQ